jgi:hypothetical protein
MFDNSLALLLLLLLVVVVVVLLLLVLSLKNNEAFLTQQLVRISHSGVLWSTTV